MKIIYEVSKSAFTSLHYFLIISKDFFYDQINNSREILQPLTPSNICK